MNAKRETPGRPAIWGGVPARNHNFTDRAELIDGIARMLADESTDGAPVTLNGLGGAGKTQLAIEYAYRFRSRYDLVWWMPADDVDTVHRSLVALGHELGLADRTVGAVLQALTQGDTRRRWLLVYDNAGGPGDIGDWVPITGPGQVLVTSRDPKWAEVGPTIDVPPRRDAVSIFYSKEDNTIRQEIAVQLAALRQVTSIELWDDTHIRGGAKWLPEIDRAIDRTKVALLLVSPDFLASTFIMNHEVPNLLVAANDDGARILCVIVRHCLFNRVEILSQFQALNSPDKPLSDLRRSARERMLVSIVDAIERALES